MKRLSLVELEQVKAKIAQLEQEIDAFKNNPERDDRGRVENLINHIGGRMIRLVREDKSLAEDCKALQVQVESLHAEFYVNIIETFSESEEESGSHVTPSSRRTALRVDNPKPVH